MNEGRFYAVLITIIGVVTIGVIGYMNAYQPEKFDVEFITRMGILASIFTGALFTIMNSNKNSKAIEHKVDDAAIEAALAKRVAAIAPDVTASKVTGTPLPTSVAYEKELIESKLAQPKDKSSNP